MNAAVDQKWSDYEAAVADAEGVLSQARERAREARTALERAGGKYRHDIKSLSTSLRMDYPGSDVVPMQPEGPHDFDRAYDAQRAKLRWMIEQGYGKSPDDGRSLSDLAAEWLERLDANRTALEDAEAEHKAAVAELAEAEAAASAAQSAVPPHSAKACETLARAADRAAEEAHRGRERLAQAEAQLRDLEERQHASPAGRLLAELEMAEGKAREELEQRVAAEQRESEAAAVERARLQQLVQGLRAWTSEAESKSEAARERWRQAEHCRRVEELEAAERALSELLAGDGPVARCMARLDQACSAADAVAPPGHTYSRARLEIRCPRLYSNAPLPERLTFPPRNPELY